MTALHRISMCADVESYSRTGPDGHERLQKTLFGVLDRALEAALGPRAAECERQPQGDAELTVLPTAIDERTILRVLFNELAGGLRRANDDFREDRRVRLRIGLDSGLVGLGPGGVTGDSPINACRLCDADAARTALRESPGQFVILVADRLFRDVVGPAFRADPVWSFSPISVQAKNFQEMGWIHLPPSEPGTPGGRHSDEPPQREGGLI